MPRTSYALKTFGSSTARMLTATPGWSTIGRPTAPRRTLRQRPTGAPLSFELAAPGLRGMRPAAWPEGRGDADRGLCRHSAREAGDPRLLRSRCQTKAPQFAFYFCQLSPYFVERDRFAPDRGAGQHKAGHSQRSVLQTAVL